VKGDFRVRVPRNAVKLRGAVSEIAKVVTNSRRDFP
jgi:hypothetical protein